MRRPITIKNGMEKLASHSGLINIGALLDAINFRFRFETINGVHCVDPKIPHADILASMIALMSIGKPDYDAIAPDEVIRVYHDHGTSEQFHSELKSDMGLERLPSGHFSSNSLILHLAMLTYNMLRIIGQISLEERDPNELPGTRQKKVSRRRIQTVMQDLMYMAGRLVTRGRQWYLSFGQLNPFFQNNGADISLSEFTTRYEVAKFSKSTRRTSICLVVGYAHNLGKKSICP